MSGFKFKSGEIVWAKSSIYGDKARPWVIINSWDVALDEGIVTDYLVCMLSTQSTPDPWSLKLDIEDVIGVSKPREQYVRPSYLVVLSELDITKRDGRVSEEVWTHIVSSLKQVLPLTDSASS